MCSVTYFWWAADKSGVQILQKTSPSWAGIADHIKRKLMPEAARFEGMNIKGQFFEDLQQAYEQALELSKQEG